MKKILYLLLCIFLFQQSNLFTQDYNLTTDKLLLKLNFSRSQASTIYDNDANQQTYFLGYVETLEDDYDYTCTLTNYEFVLNAEYKFDSSFGVAAEFPFRTADLREKYWMYDEGVETSIGSLNFDNQWFNVNLKAYYTFFRKKTFGAFSLEARIPTSYNSVEENIADSVFLGDGCVEFVPGFDFGIDFEKTRLLTNIKYRYRTEDYSDMLSIRMNLGLTTIKPVVMNIFAEYGYSFESFKNVPEFVPRHEVLYENYLSVGGEVIINVSDKYRAEFGYLVDFWGKHHWKTGKFYLGAGILL